MPSNRKATEHPAYCLPTFYADRKAVDFNDHSYVSPLRNIVCTPSTTDSRSARAPHKNLFVSAPPPHAGRAPASARTGGAQFTIIANVPYDTVRQDLVSEFRKFGRVELAMVVCDEASRHPHKEWTSTAGYAFVRFSKRSEAAAAIQAATIGLITIRGTRVRADWARKDSYAKRGRVSPAQGAPAIGPFGVPDGISLLRDSLNGGVVNTESWQPYARPDDRNEAVLQALENAFASAFHMVDGDQRIDGNLMASDDESVAERQAVTLPTEDESAPLFTSGQNLEAVLSPVSRNLLAGALSDVTAPEGFFLTDVSPLAGGDARFFSFDKSILLPPESDFVCEEPPTPQQPDGASDFTTTNPSPACESIASDFSSTDEFGGVDLSNTIIDH